MLCVLHNFREYSLFGIELILILCSSSLFVVRMNFRKLGIKNFQKLIIPLIRKFRK